MNNYFDQYINELNNALKEIERESLDKCVQLLCKSIKNDNSIFICGNGGSAGNANHIANDLHFSFISKTGPSLKVISLSSNIALVSCIANDHGYEFIYSNQIRALSKPGDILITLSGSGNSNNIIEALRS